MNSGNRIQVPVSGQVTGIEETEAVIAVLESKHFAGGKVTEAFEHEFAEYIGKKHALFVNSGSSANLLAVSALLEVRHESEFVTPACAFPTTINPLIQTRQKITLVDVALDTLLPESATYGAMTLGNYRDYPLITDSCDAMFPGQYTGLAQTFSFFPAHHMTTGEGGMITTDDTEFYRVARSLRDWGRDCWCLPGNDNTCGKRFSAFTGFTRYDHKYIYTCIGYNMQATDMQAAIGREQLKKLPEFTATRVRNFKHLDAKMRKLESFFYLPMSVKEDTPWFGYPLIVRDNAPFNRDDITLFLQNKGIGSRPIFAGNIARQPAYRDVKFKIPHKLVNADKIMRSGFWVGTWHGLTEAQLDYSASMIEEFVYRSLMP